MLRRILTVISAAALLSVGIVAGTTPAHAVGMSYTSTPYPGLKTDGVVRAVDVVGQTAYLGGQFTTVTGTNGQFARANFAAIDIPSQQVITTFKADVNNAVFAVKATPSVVFVGGDFTTVNGAGRKRLAALEPATGALRTTFTKGEPSGRVRAIEIAGGQLWVGGGFDFVSGTPRSAVAAMSLTSGVLAPFAVDADKTIRTIKASNDGNSVFIAGDFTTLVGLPKAYIAKVDAVTGVVAPLNFPQLSIPGDNLVLALAVDPIRNLLYGGIGGVKGVGLGNEVVAWDLDTGLTKWVQITDGDVQALAVRDDNVYFGFHEGFAGDATVRLLAANAATGALDNRFRPTINSFFGVWALNATPFGLVAGGEFTQVNGVDARRVAIFPISNAVSISLLTGSSTWKYRDVGSAAEAGWNTESFNDGAWASGTPQFGYGDGDETTVVSYGAHTTTKYITTYFRTTINVDDPTKLSDIYANTVVDDGAVIYVNGVEIVRDNMPAGPLTGTTFAASARDGVYESAIRPFQIPASAFHPGANVISVEVHQVTASSSDLSFAFTLDATLN